MLDIHQLIPLPAAADYQVRLRRKEAARERAVAAGGSRDFTRFVVSVDGVKSPDYGKRHAMRVLVAALAERVPLEEIRKVLPDRKMRVLNTIVENSAAVRSAMEAQGADGRRWFNDHPLLDRQSGWTYVLSNQWGVGTEPTMTALVDAFPDTGVTFRRAEESEPAQSG